MIKIKNIPKNILLLTLIGCSIFKSADELFLDAERKRNNGEPKESIIILKQLLSKFTEHEKASEAQYLIAEIYYRDLRDFSKSIEEYEKLKNNFPNSSKVPFALFMQGFIYANMLSDYDFAKTYYSEFLEEYSNHELAESVSFELKYLGLDIKEIPTLKHLTK